MKGFDVSTIGTRWKVDVGQRELRADVADIVRHAPQDHVGDSLGRIAARGAVAMDLLDPFEIDHRDHADLQVGMARDVDLVGDDGAVQPLIEEEVAAAGKASHSVKVPGGAPNCAASASSWM